MKLLIECFKYPTTKALVKHHKRNSFLFIFNDKYLHHVDFNYGLSIIKGKVK